MAVYAIGDLQGCLAPLEQLLDQVRFDPTRDRLWLVGDLVNRGPDSLGCLQRVRDLGQAAITVLGNHDLHLLATAAGVRSPRPRDTLLPVLEHPAAADLIEWLAQQPLLHCDPDLGWTLVHAGLPPHWTLAQAQREAAAVSQVLRDPHTRQDFIEQMYGNEPAQWHEQLTGTARLRYTVNALTRMRYLRRDGSLDLEESGPPQTAPRHLTPWFAYRRRVTQGQPIVFGHWSTLGFRQGPDWMSLDSGCVWGKQMTLVRLDATEPGEACHWQVRC